VDFTKGSPNVSKGELLAGEDGICKQSPSANTGDVTV
jgi:hypothetical protein